jgi:hypothetical protein
MPHSACCHGMEGRSVVYEGLMDVDNVEGSKILRCFSDPFLDKVSNLSVWSMEWNVAYRGNSY